MKRTRLMAAVAAGAVIATGLAACGGSSGGGNKSSGGTKTTSAFNAASGKVLSPSDKRGGTLRFAHASDWDSLDPADTYYGYSWNFIRNYGRSLTVFKASPGAPTVVPDLAESLGKPSDNAKTWTYTIRKGVKFEDGTVITSKDVKYGIERSLDKTTFPQGPTYFNDFMDLKGYTSPYKDSDPNKLGLKAIETPDDQTIVFHLNQTFAGMDYFAQLPATIPVPQAKDTGTKYKEHVISSGPYMFKTNQLGKRFTMVRNPNYDPATDPDSGRKPLADTIQVDLNVNADDVDNRLLAGDLDVAVDGTGLKAAAQGKVLRDPKLKAEAENPSTTRLWFAVLNSDVPPLDNIHCRKAVLFAADKTGYQRAYGGSIGGDIAPHMMPPLVPGSTKTDLYEALTKPGGDDTKAKQELQACGQPTGFATNISYRAERPPEKATAEALQQSLAKVGIKLTIKPYPEADYTKLYAGKPDYAKKNKLGVKVYGWAADWPDGYGFLAQIVDSRVIKPVGGNTNLGIKVPAADALLDKALATTDQAAREKIWGQIDQAVMASGYVLPGVWAKGLFFRPGNLTNVFINPAFGEYDYAALGTTRK